MKTKTKILAILTLLLLGFFICLKIIYAAETDIIITEIAAYEKSNYEWLEIYNKGTEPVDLNDWKFYEAETNHKLNEFQDDLIIEPGEYAIIADVGENFKKSYPDFTGTIIDSSWSSLKESGEEITLKNANGDIIETFTYLPCPDTSLQRIDLNSNNYTETNWQIHETGNSAGKENEFNNQNDPPQDPTEEPDPEPEPEPDPEPEPEPDSPQPSSQKIVSSGTLVINEFVSDPADGEVEWIELYNKNVFDIDLTGWQILDGTETKTELSGTIGSNFDSRFFVIEKPKGRLNNSGDSIILKDPQNNIIDAVSYGKWGLFPDENAPAAKDPFSTARIFDGAHTFKNKNDFVVTETPTKGETNLITITEIQEKNYDHITDIKIEKKKTNYKEQIAISEIYPNPPGSDLEFEWLELKNISQEDVDLTDWKITDKSKKIFKISSKNFVSTIIKPNEFFIIERKISGIAFNNNKDTIKLIGPNDKTVQTVKYSEDENVPENVSYIINEEGEWQFTTTPTKNQANVFTQLNHAPEIEIYCPKKAEIGETITCDASDSYDLEDDILTFVWQVAGQIYKNVIMQHQFQEKGRYQINLLVNDGQAETKETHKIKITEPENQSEKKTSKNTNKNNKTKNNNNDSVAIMLEDIRRLKKDTKVITRGIVSVLPNVFGKTTMYLAGSGVQLYMYKADWPDLKIGDLVEINGILSESRGETRVKLASKQDIIIIENQLPPEPKQIKINEIGENLEGYLIKISGQLIEKSGSKFYLQDETGEALIYIKQKTKIKKTKYLEGDQLTVIGVISQNNDEYRILPRSNKDIKKEQTINEGETIALEQNNKNEAILKYLLTGAVFLVFGLVAIFYSKKSKKSES